MRLTFVRLFSYGRVVGNVSASVASMALTGGSCAWAKGLSVALTVADFGNAAYALQTGDVSSAVSTLVGQTIGFGAGKLAKGHIICFVEGTQVATQGEDGEIAGKSIEDIKAGDWVWSRNEETGEEGFKPVVQVFRNEADTLAQVTYTTGGAGFQPATSTQTLTGTPSHPFWSLTRNGWVAMGKLATGETLLLAGGETATVSSCRLHKPTRPTAVYNFEVADWHTYHVGSNQGWVWVHNTCNPNIKTDKLGRVRSAFAKITAADIGTGTSTNAATRAAARAMGNSGDDAGHLIGRLLGGPGGKSAGNFVPQLSSVNRGAFRDFEQRIAGNALAGNNVFVRVKPIYTGAGTRPSALKYQVRVNGKSWAPAHFGN